MNPDGRDHAEENLAAREAADWLARLRGAPGAVLTEAHAAWLARSPHNRRAFERVSRAFDGAGILRHSPRYSAIGRRRAARRRSALIAGGALAVGGALAACVLVVGPMIARQPVPQAVSRSAQLAFATAQGEIRRFRLPDGSVAILDTASRLELRFDGRERLLHLVAGRARLILVDDERPLRIEAGAGAIAARAATLDIHLTKDRVAVTVIEGKVAVRKRGGGESRASVGLAKGQYLALTAGGVASQTARAPRSEADWPSGWAEYGAVPLGDLVTAANRYAVVPIVIDEPRLRATRLTGRFHLADPRGLADRTAQLLDLELEPVPGAVYLRSRKKVLPMD